MIHRVLGALALVGAATAAQAQTASSDELARRAIERRAIEAINWGMPAVNLDLMRKAEVKAVTDIEELK